MKRKVLLFIFLLGLFGSAYCQNIYWVDNDGAATWIQAQNSTPLSGAAAASLIEANANAQPGDIIFMRGGNYFTTIKPSNSGTSGNPITYQQYMDEDVVFDGILLCIDLDAISYIVVDGISCTNTTDAWARIRDNSNYNTIKNSIFDVSISYAGIAIANGTHHTSIINSKFRGSCSRTTNYPGGPPNGQGTDNEAGGPTDFIFINGSNYNLIEGNDFAEGGFHYAVSSKGNYTVYRNNIFHNRLHGQLGPGGPGAAIGVVIENNTFLETGRDRLINYCGQPRDREMPPEKQNQLNLTNMNRTIIRGNLFIDGGNAVANSNWRGPIIDQHVYNNTMYKNEINYQMISPGESAYRGDVVVNNILVKAVQYEIKSSGKGRLGHTICNNNIWSPTGRPVQYGTNNTCNNSNLNIDPLFVSEAETPIESDLHLQAASPMIDVGQWLTIITSSTGSGTSFTVTDAKFFFDGYGLVKGDVIQLEGQEELIRIARVDYNTNTITVGSSITWTQGLGVALPYNGNKPDMGAYEYMSASSGGQTPYKGVVWELPGVLEVENYDNGGEGLAYYDQTIDNVGGKYRTDSVDIYAAGDLGGGYIIGNMEAGEWMEYSVNVFHGGAYAFSARIASAVSTGKYSISIDGVDVTGTMDVPNTGGDQIWQTVSTNNISLTSGLHILRINVVAGGFNLNNLIVADTDAPSIPTALAVTNVTSGSISISWTASTDNIGVVEYDIYKNGVLLGTASTNEYTDNKLLIPGKTYSYTVVAKDIAGNASAQSEAVEATTLQYQKITITSIPDKFTKDDPFDVEATVTTGLPLIYEVSGPATISEKTITLDGNIGTVEVTATQVGDATYGITSKTTSFEVMLVTDLSGPQAGLEDVLPTLKIYPIPATDWLNIEGTYSDNTMVQVIDILGKQVLFESLVNNRLSISNLQEGAYILKISDNGLTSKSKIIIQR